MSCMRVFEREHHPIVASVVAGGWSMTAVSHEWIPGPIVAVNDAAFALRRRPDFVVSMDRLWAENRWERLCEMQAPTWLRRSAVQNLPPAAARDDWPWPWLTVFGCDHTAVAFADGCYAHEVSPHFSRSLSVLNGTNSGVCGLNLAWIMRPRILLLFGFDMQDGPRGQRHWYPSYPWVTGKGTTRGKFREWARQFSEIAEQFRKIGTQVVNVSHRSLIPNFPKLHPADLEKYARMGFPDGAVADYAA